jgi:hypothetical protein
MELQDNVLKAFADAVNSSGDTSSDGNTFYATVVRKDGDTVYVRLSGADESTETPAISMVEVGKDDIVMVRMKAHKATIIGNISFPALTRVGDVYITLTKDGLVVGKLDPKTNLPTGTHVLITDKEFQLIGEDNKTILARFGAEVSVGSSSAPHVIINGSNMIFYNASGEEVLRAGFGTSNWSSYKGIETQGSIVANNGRIMSYISGDSANGRVTAGSGALIAPSVSGGWPIPERDIELIASQTWVGLHSHNNPNGWIIWYNLNDNRTYLYSHQSGSTNKTVAVSDLLRGGVTQLWSGNLTVAASSTDWSELNLSPLLRNWDVAAVRVHCGRMYTTVMIVRSEGAAEHRVADYNYTYGGSSQTLMAAVRIDWAAGVVGIKRTLGPSDANAVELYQIMSVHGVVRAV